MSLVPDFNIATDFNSEFMHSVLLGVTRQFTYLMLDTSSRSKKYYFGKESTAFRYDDLKCETAFRD